MGLINKLYLNKTSLASILASAFEVYPREAYGLLFGNIKPNGKYKDYFMEVVFPLQTAERKYSYTEIDDNIKKRIKRVFFKFNFNFLGDYHSHTKYRKDFEPNLKLSGYDLSFVKNNHPLISLILAIKPSKKRKINRRIKIDEKLKELIIYYLFKENKKGFKNKIYKIKIGAYTWDKETHKPELIEISLKD